MIRNKKDNEPVTQAALTRAEAEQILSGKRDQIYRCVMTAVVFFAAVSVMVMFAFKQHEGFFDASSRIGILMERPVLFTAEPFLQPHCSVLSFVKSD